LPPLQPLSRKGREAFTFRVGREVSGRAIRGSRRPFSLGATMDQERVIPNSNRALQVSKTRRKLFGRARQQAFLEHLARPATSLPRRARPAWCRAPSMPSG
jgi:hypothetical protein